MRIAQLAVSRCDGGFMSNIENLELRLQLEEGRKQKAFEKMQAAKKRLKRLDAKNLINTTVGFRKSVLMAFYGAVVGVLAASALKESTVAEYLQSPENMSMTQDLMSTIGVDNVYQLRSFLLSGDELAETLYTSCGAQEYFYTFSAEVIAASAVLGGAIYGVPVVYSHIQQKRRERCFAEYRRQASNYHIALERCDMVESLIKEQNTDAGEGVARLPWEIEIDQKYAYDRQFYRDRAAEMCKKQS